MHDDMRQIFKGLFGGGYEPNHLRELPDHLLPVEHSRTSMRVLWRFSCPKHSNPALQRLRGVLGRDAEGRCVVIEEKRL